MLLDEGMERRLKAQYEELARRQQMIARLSDAADQVCDVHPI